MGVGGVEERRTEGRRGGMSSPRREMEAAERGEERVRVCIQIGNHLPFSGPDILQEAYVRHGEARDEASDVE